MMPFSIALNALKAEVLRNPMTVAQAKDWLIPVIGTKASNPIPALNVISYACVNKHVKLGAGGVLSHV